MAKGMWLFRVVDGVETPTLPLRGRPQTLGRGRDCDVVLVDGAVSSHHAAVWVEESTAFVRDLGSRNGTFVDDAKVVGVTQLQEGARIRLSSGQQFVVRAHGTARESGWAVDALFLEFVDAQVKKPFFGSRFVYGGEHSDVAGAAGTDGFALAAHDDGEIWLSTLDADMPIVLDEAFTVEGKRFRVVREQVMAGYSVTTDTVESRMTYRMVVNLNGVSGPEALIEDVGRTRRHVIDAENRAVLLYALARRAQAADVADDGWCSDDDVTRDVWGKKGSADANGLHVLVHRLRKELKEAGFDPWFIEKRRKAIRLALREVEIVGASSAD